MGVNLILLRKNGKHKKFPLTCDIITIGRQNSCDLRIPLMTVSKKHCQLKCKNNQPSIRDLGSSNGTKLNGKPIKESPLKNGDRFKVGPLEFLFQTDTPQQNSEPTDDNPNPSGEDFLKELKQN